MGGILANTLLFFCIMSGQMCRSPLVQLDCMDNDFWDYITASRMYVSYDHEMPQMEPQLIKTRIIGAKIRSIKVRCSKTETSGLLKPSVGPFVPHNLSRHGYALQREDLCLTCRLKVNGAGTITAFYFLAECEAICCSRA